MSYIGSKPADAVLETDDITDGIITTSKLADNSVTTAKTSYQDAPFRNIIINGDMSIAQRGTSFSNITSGSAHFGVDRFNFEVSSLGTWTISQDSDVPTGQGFAKSLKLDCTTADASPSATDYIVITQSIEGQNLQYLKKGTSNAESLTASFWVKSNKTGTYIAELKDVDNNRTINKSYTINSSNTWEKKTITYDGDTTGTLDNDNGNSFQLNFWLGGGSNWTSGTLQTSWGSNTLANRQVGQVNLADNTANEWLITGVMLESGTVASSFETLPVDIQLMRCQRYYWNYVSGTDNEIGIGAYISSSEVDVIIMFPQTMRGNPTLDIVTGSGYYKINRSGASDSFNSFSIARATNKSCLLYNVSEVSGTQGQAGEVLSGNSNAFLSFSSEL